MKVLTITTDYLPKIGGISNHIYYLNKHLIKIGVNVQVLHIVENSEEDKVVSSNDEFIVHKFHIKDSLKGLKKLKYRLIIKKLLRKKFSDFDIIHTHEIFNTEYLVDNLNYKWVWTNHTSRFNEFINETALKSRIKQFIEYIQLSKANRIICVSQFVEENTRRYFGNKKQVSVIPNGIELGRFQILDNDYLKNFREKLSLPPDATVVLIVARWYPVKGIHVVIDAMKILKEKYFEYYKKFFFVFAGSGDADISYRQIQNDRISEFNNYMKIDIVKKEDIPYLYASGDIMLIPSLYESAPVALLEAMGSNKVVLAAKVGGLQYLLKDGQSGFFFKKENAGELVEKLIMLQREGNSDLINKVRATAYNEVCQKYTWLQVAEKTKRVYESLL